MGVKRQVAMHYARCEIRSVDLSDWCAALKPPSHRYVDVLTMLHNKKTAITLGRRRVLQPRKKRIK